jgi:uncharacterized protein with von Willebrand factor type A (vWA) domain
LKAAKEGKLAMGKGNPDAARPLDLSKISLELRKELEEFLKSLPESTREDLEKRGAARLKEASDAAAAALEGKAGRDAPDNKSGLGTKGEATLQPSVAPESLADLDASALRRHVSITPDGTEGIRREFDRILNQDRGPYDNTVRENAATINHLESELRAIFHKRRQSHRESGRRSGPTLNINRFINERTSGKHPVESRAFEQKTRPLEKDYAVMILVDVSGSMQDKIQHAFAAAVACTEAFSSLNIEHSIWGFNEHLYPYKKFDEKTDPAKICSMEADVHSDAAQWNDDGWALTEVVKKLRARSERELILIVLSDGEPFPSSAHAGAQFKLNKVTRHIESDGKIRLIGLGMGQGTDHVKNFYRNSRANIPIDGLPGELSEVIRDAISGENKG